jgi:hypothetical protein
MGSEVDTAIAKRERIGATAPLPPLLNRDFSTIDVAPH